MTSEGDPNRTVRIRRPQPGQVSQPLPVQPPPPAGPPAPPHQGQPTGPHSHPAFEGPGTVRLPYTPDELPPVVYAPPPKARRHRVVIGVIVFLVLLGALVFGAFKLYEASAGAAAAAAMDGR
ncbi:hypothetical protein ACFSKW_48660 [Nonomuraea mangrovi]|uniref:Serine/threonine protein kinase n=1 Tax=Nonomuraea mangrovi TaxID=2316207 RepID=A0ABW4TCD3_9ACTN